MGEPGPSMQPRVALLEERVAHRERRVAALDESILANGEPAVVRTLVRVFGNRRLVGGMLRELGSGPQPLGEVRASLIGSLLLLLGGGACPGPSPDAGPPPDPAHTYAGTNGMFADHCDTNGNLIDYRCESVLPPCSLAARVPNTCDCPWCTQGASCRWLRSSIAALLVEALAVTGAVHNKATKSPSRATAPTEV
jgi:hypothetical protein